MKYTLHISVIVTLLLVSGCSNGISDEKSSLKLRYDTFKVDKKISRQPVFRYMNETYEPLNLVQIVDRDTIRQKATSAVTLVKLNDAKDRIQTTDGLKCKARIIRDTLWISIGFSNGYSGSGINVNVSGNRFSALPYQFYDVMTDEKKPIITIEKQKLVLDKPAYLVGDSLYGHIYLRTIDTDTTKQYAQGHFRTIITKE